MKKLGLGIIALLVVGAIYYFTAGSEQITAEIKKQVNSKLTSIQKEGFSVQNREIKEASEHFILSFDNPKKIVQFFSHQGIQTNVNDVQMLKGLKVAVDIKYLADTYSAVSFDIYPVMLPTAITSATTSVEDKKLLTQVEKMLDQKIFIMHISVNKLGNGFKGYMNDINKVLHGEKDIRLNMKGLTFFGGIKDNAISSIKQDLKTLTMNIVDKIKLSFADIHSDYAITGKTPYDYTATYNMGKIDVSTNTAFNFTSNSLHIESISRTNNGLVSGSLISTIKKISIKNKKQTYAFNTFVFETNASGLDISAFDKLQEINVNNRKEVNALIQQMISKGVHFEIPKCSVASIESQGQQIDGFNITAKVDVDKTFNIIALETNPMSALSAVDANLNITLSKGLFSEIKKIPQAMLALMVLQPKDKNGKKVFRIELKKGKVTVNGMPIL